LERAVARCVDELGGLDFVMYVPSFFRSTARISMPAGRRGFPGRRAGGWRACRAGAAGNFLAPLGQLSSNAFKAVVEIDLVGSFHVLRAALPHLRASAARNRPDGKTGKSSLRRGLETEGSAKDAEGWATDAASPTGTGGRIIFVSATLHYAGSALQLHASAAKAGVDAVSASVCIEEGPRGVTSNVIAPGAIAGTEGMSRLAPAGAGGGAWRGVPAGRPGYAREIADATVFLFSEAGNYVNGSVVVGMFWRGLAFRWLTLTVDGGGWRTKMQPGAHFEYPDFLLADGEVTGVKGTRQSKIWLLGYVIRHRWEILETWFQGDGLGVSTRGVRKADVADVE
jgi:NAD(P)-dependent dehydrogenase (short-subunit alcohol dehydrogenase family)